VPVPKSLRVLEDIFGQLPELTTVSAGVLHPKALLYGRPKAWKTTTAAGVGERPLLFAVDTGWSSLKDYPELNEKVTFEPCRGLKHFKYFTEAIREDLPRYREFDHIIIDPVNKLSAMYLDFLQNNYKPSGAIDSQRVHWIPVEGSDEDPFTTPGWGDYHAVRNWFRDPVAELTKAPVMVTWICHAKVDMKTGILKPDLPESLYTLLCAEVDFIGHMEVNQGTSMVSFESSTKKDAGSRARKLNGKKISAQEYSHAIDKWRRGEL